MDKDLQSQLIADLVMESGESLQEFDRDLLTLERREGDEETLNRMFRAIHSLKGSSGCLGLPRIERLAHAGENLLALMRDGSLQPTEEIVSSLLACGDGLRVMIAHVGATGSEPDHDHERLLADLQALAVATSCNVMSSEAAFGLFEDDEGLATAGSENAPVHDPVFAADSAAPAPAESAIRVAVEQLDTMMDLVGELVLARNQIMQFAGRAAEASVASATQRLNVITTKLQETVMRTRMQPIGNVWNRFPRIARDVARELGKQVRLVMDGKETELDRNIIESIKDPLTHLVRNAIDHGLETPEQRIASGKPAEGLLRLRAFHEGGQVNIEVFDDGGGIDREKVAKKAVQRGLLTPADAARLSDREILALIFAPGFSTAEQVTNLSGRGVGMDVVKKNVERIGGSVDIQSEPGRSTSIRIKIPLTLAIIPALIVGCARRRYAIPQVSLVELVRIEAADVAKKIDSVGGAPMFRLRGELLPLLYLREQLGLPPAANSDDCLLLLVLRAESKQFALLVDSVCDTEEIVVKPLGKELKNVSVYAGATIMGDGSVALILDVLGLARSAGMLDDSAAHADAVVDDLQAENADQQSLLVFSVGEQRTAAIPLLHAARLEEFAPTQIELAGGHEVVQYRGEIMPLLRLNQALKLDRTETNAEHVPVIVYNHKGRTIGMVVSSILDIVTEHVSMQSITNQAGILGSAIVKNRVTDFIDTQALIDSSGLCA